jgi:hypothetical protein
LGDLLPAANTFLQQARRTTMERRARPPDAARHLPHRLGRATNFG